MVRLLTSPFLRANNIYLNIGTCVPPFGKELFPRLIVCSPCNLSNFSFCYFPLVASRAGFWF